MESIHNFEGFSDVISASAKKLALFPGKDAPPVFLRHTLKDGIPLGFWFVIETEKFWFDVDLRKLLNVNEGDPLWGTLTEVRDELRGLLRSKEIDADGIPVFLRDFSDVMPESITAERKRKE